MKTEEQAGDLFEVARQIFFSGEVDAIPKSNQQQDRAEDGTLSNTARSLIQRVAHP
jgi:hypothetical protein